MISVKKARVLVKKMVRRLAAEMVPVKTAANRVLAQPLRAVAPYPAFDNSAMDGYAVRWRDCRKASAAFPLEMPVAGRTLAGHAPGRLASGHAWAVMTGAPLPRGADAVIQRELCIEHGGSVRMLQAPGSGDHIRRRGEDWRRGSVLLPAGAVLNPGALAVAAASGRARVACVSKPKVALLITGDELADPGRKLQPGQIYDSNGPMLAGALILGGCVPVLTLRVPDRLKAFKAAIRSAMRRCDVLLLSGGVSVGDKDHSKEALISAGVREVFWRVAQRPGKPLFFGVRSRKLVFGLPGNPAAALVCFLEYVAPALAALQGRAFAGIERKAVLGERLVNFGGRQIFYRAAFRGGKVRVLARQGSHVLSSLAEANCLLPVPARARWKAGREVSVHLFGSLA